MEPKSKIDQWSTIISTILAVAGVVVGIWEFNFQERVTETQVFKQKLWEQRQSVYTDLARCTGYIIAFRNNPVLLDSIKIQYQNLYYSSLPMFVDSSVEAPLIAFNVALETFQKEKNQDHELLLKEKQILLMKSLGTSMRHITDIMLEEAPSSFKWNPF